VREKGIRKSKSTKKKESKKPPPCSYCHEDGHNVQTCTYMEKSTRDTKSNERNRVEALV
jgi:hypothetical protein